MLKTRWQLNWIGTSRYERYREFPTGTLVVLNERGMPYNVIFRWIDGEVTNIKFGVYWRFIAKFYAMRWVRRHGNRIGNKP